MGFASGFNAGSSAIRSYQDAELAKQREERAKEEARRASERHEFEMADRRRTQGLQRKQDEAFDNLDFVSSQGVMDNRTGISQPSAQMLARGGYAGATGPAAVQEAAGDFQREMARFRGAGAGPVDAPAYDGSAAVGIRKATRNDVNTAQQRVALASRDSREFSRLRQESQGFAEEDAFNENVKAALKDPKVAQQSLRLANLGSSRVSGVPGKDGYTTLTIVQDDGEAIAKRMSPVQMAKLHGAYGLMEVNPAKALDIISGVDKDLGAAVAAESGMVVQLAQGNNQTQRYRNADANDAARTRIAADAARAQREQAAQRAQLERMGLIRQYQDPKTGEVKEYYPVTGPQGVRWEEFRRPEGLTPVGKPVDQNTVFKYAEGLLGQPKPGLDPSGKPGRYTWEDAVEAAEARYGLRRPGQGGIDVPDRPPTREEIEARRNQGRAAPADAAPSRPVFRPEVAEVVGGVRDAASNAVGGLGRMFINPDDPRLAPRQ